MLESIFNFIIKLFFWLIGIIGSVVITPVQLIFEAIIPGLDEYIDICQNFLINRVFPMAFFAKEIFLDLSCIPRPLFSIFIIFVISRWAVAPAVRSIKLLINIWKLSHGGDMK